MGILKRILIWKRLFVNSVMKSEQIGAIFIHATWLPYILRPRELKTKPTQHSVKELMAAGIRPNILYVGRIVRLTRASARKSVCFVIFLLNVISALDVFYL